LKKHDIKNFPQNGFFSQTFENKNPLGSQILRGVAIEEPQAGTARQW
jgi:hypothetical protein